MVCHTECMDFILTNCKDKQIQDTNYRPRVVYMLEKTKGCGDMIYYLGHSILLFYHSLYAK